MSKLDFLSLTKYHYVYMYSLKSDSWRKVESTEDLHLASDYMGPCESPLDELYFLEGDMSINPQTYSILRFDLKSEKFVEIAAPSLENPYSFFFASWLKEDAFTFGKFIMILFHIVRLGKYIETFVSPYQYMIETD